MAPYQQWLSQKMVEVEEDFRKFLKDRSFKVPALKDLLDRPLDLGTVELMERALRDRSWGWYGDNVLRSLKLHGSSPERVLDLLYFLLESSDEKMHKMDLDDVTLEQVAAARSALREAIRDAELAVKKRTKWDFRRSAPWLGYLSASWCPGSKHLPSLRAMDARASILMTRLGDEAEKENDAACLQEVA